MDNKRCLSILHNIKDNLFAIHTELTSDYQDGKYLMEKLNPILHDSKVLKYEFELLQREQKLKEGE